MLVLVNGPEIWQFTTIESKPYTPTLSQPSNNSTGVSIAPTISWSSVSGATAYDIIVSTSSSFAFGASIYDERITNPYKSAGGLTNNTIYYWKVRSVNAVGTSDWTSAWSFKTIEAVPNTVTLKSPQNASTDQP